MKHVKIIGLALLAMFVFSAVGATAAMAEEAPYFGVESKRLAAGETRGFTTTKASTEYTLKSAKQIVKCKNQTTAAGAKLIGSNAGEPGTNEETVEFSGCIVEANGTPCSVVEPIKTNPLRTELLYDTAKKSVLTEFVPVTPPKFVELSFTGSGCEVTKTVVEGSLAAETLNGLLVLVQLGVAPTLETTGDVRFPEASIKAGWLIKAGVGAETKFKLIAFGTSSTLIGETTISLLSGQKWCVIA